jgi:hypothetical protein
VAAGGKLTNRPSALHRSLIREQSCVPSVLESRRVSSNRPFDFQPFLIPILLGSILRSICRASASISPKLNARLVPRRRRHTPIEIGPPCACQQLCLGIQLRRSARAQGRPTHFCLALTSGASPQIHAIQDLCRQLRESSDSSRPTVTIPTLVLCALLQTGCATDESPHLEFGHDFQNLLRLILQERS